MLQCRIVGPRVWLELSKTLLGAWLSHTHLTSLQRHKNSSLDTAIGRWPAASHLFNSCTVHLLVLYSVIHQSLSDFNFGRAPSWSHGYSQRQDPVCQTSKWINLRKSCPEVWCIRRRRPDSSCSRSGSESYGEISSVKVSFMVHTKLSGLTNHSMVVILVLEWIRASLSTPVGNTIRGQIT